MKGGNLQDLIEKRNSNNQSFSEEEAATIMKSILNGVKYLHLKDIIHRDLKPHNILISDPNDLTSIKICDFGLSGIIESKINCNSNFQDTAEGTPLYMAPEQIREDKYSKQVDI